MQQYRQILKSVYQGHPRETYKVVTVDRWPFRQVLLEQVLEGGNICDHYGWVGFIYSGGQ